MVDEQGHETASNVVARVRWSFAGTLLIALVAVTATSSRGGRLQVCSDTCPATRPLTLADPPVVLALALVVLLLLPDLSRISIAGIVELERAVEKASSAVSDTQEEVSRLRADIALNASVASLANARNETNVYLATPDEIEQRLRRKRQEYGDVL